MKTAKELKNELDGMLARVEAIHGDAQRSNRELSTAEKSEIDAILNDGGKAEALRQDITRAAKIENETRIRAGVALNAMAGKHFGSDEQASIADRFGKGSIVLNKHQGIQANRSNWPANPMGELIRAMVIGSQHASPMIKAALSEGSNSAGGFLVPEELSDMVLDKSRAQSVLVDAGCQIVGMKSDSKIWAKVVTDPEMEIKAENAAFSEGSVTFGNVQAIARTIGCLLTCSNELLEDAPNAAELLDSVLSKSLGAELDRLGLAGSGSSGEPIGLLNNSDIPSTGSIAAIAWADLSSAATAIRVANYVPGAFVFHPSIAEDLALLADSTGQPLNPPENVRDVPRMNTTNCTVTKAVCGDFSNLYWVIRRNPVIEASRVAGDAFKKNQTLIRITWRGDVLCTQPTAFYNLTGITT